MMDRETVIKGIQECDLNGGLIGNCPYKGVLTLLKEQEHKDKMFHALEDDWKRLKELLKEQEAEKSKISNAYLELVGKASKQPEIVRCKDCKHGKVYWAENGQLVSCELQELATELDWFCADGERAVK